MLVGQESLLRIFAPNRKFPQTLATDGSRSAEPGLRCSGGRGVAVARTQIQPHLTVVDVEAGQASILPVTENQMLARRFDRQTRSLHRRCADAGVATPVRATPPSSQHQRHVLILIDAELSP